MRTLTAGAFLLAPVRSVFAHVVHCFFLSNRSSYQRLLPYALPYWRRWILVALATVGSSVLAVAQPWPVQWAVDHVLGDVPLPGWLSRIFNALPWTSTKAELLGWIALSSLLIYLISAAGNAVLSWQWVYVGRRMVYELSNDLFAALLRRSLIFHSSNSVGDLISRLTGDSWCVYRAADMLVFTPLQALLTLAFMLCLMFRMDVKLTLISLSAVPLMAASSMLLRGRIGKVARARRDIEGRIQSHVHQTLVGMPAVQAFGQEERERQKFEDHATMAIRAHGRGVVVKSAGQLTSGLLPTLATAGILWFGVDAVMQKRVSVGELLVFIAYLRGLNASAVKLTDTYAAFAETSASADRVFEILDQSPEVAEAPNAISLGRSRGGIAFDRVIFGYDQSRPVLRDLSLDIRPGETLAIVGGTGAGKSTLASLVPRLFDPWSGTVRIDGHDLKELTLGSLRDQIALVLQEPFLFPLTIAANIAYGRPAATLEQIHDAARAANAHDFISSLPQGYDTVIGERGITLSGGERQRLSIARALLRDAPILILDEPTSALDAATEQSVLEALRRLMQGRTTLMIAHRLSTVRQADRIIVLDHGQILEQGSHEQLIQLGGKYASLHQTQFGRPVSRVSEMAR